MLQVQVFKIVRRQCGHRQFEVMEYCGVVCILTPDERRAARQKELFAAYDGVPQYGGSQNRRVEAELHFG